MKKIFTIWLLSMLAVVSAWAQSSPYRMDRAVLSKAPMLIYIRTLDIEDALNNNIKVLQSKPDRHILEDNYMLSNPLKAIEWLENYIKNDSINNKKFKKSALAQIRVERYRQEYAEQLLQRDKLMAKLTRERFLQDSLEKAEEEVKKAALEKARKEAQEKAQKEKEAQMTGYERLGLHLDGIGELPNGSFTYFRGLDLNFVNFRFGFFLQDRVMRLSPTKNFKWEKGKYLVQKYIPRSDTDNEYVTVKYYLRPDRTIPPYIETGDGVCDVVTKVEIEGTADLMIRLFLRYWPSQVKVGGYKQGEIAHYQIMGDYVMLVGTEKYNICKIIITKGNIEADYYKTFRIER